MAPPVTCRVRRTHSEHETPLTAAIALFLTKNGFEKISKKLVKELLEAGGEMPRDLDGEWKWIEYETESESES